VEDILEVVKKGSVEKVTDFLNGLDDSNKIKFTYEVEQDGQLPFLDLLLNRTENGDLKLQIYRKQTHTDQYLNFSSHHPTEHKLSVMRTLLERSHCLVTDNEDRNQEDSHVEAALRACGYPKWTFNKVRRQIESKRDKKTRQQCDSSKPPMVVIKDVTFKYFCVIDSRMLSNRLLIDSQILGLHYGSKKMTSTNMIAIA